MGDAMLKYVSIMVLAYREATGKSEEEALRDLAIDDFVCVQDLENITSKELLSTMPRDIPGIMAWAEAANK
ncbi:MAG: hypothetical protein BA864_15965 [Desulfuromonadales bacterium C00003093]|nr:MAG: hypothetical protein BA864_15965 [Desulfuromonadales bacterium C00003093]